MPTERDETLQERYQREHAEQLAAIKDTVASDCVPVNIEFLKRLSEIAYKNGYVRMSRELDDLTGGSRY